MNQPVRKRLVFCFDGTWNRLSADNPTNVVKLAQMVEPVTRNGTPQIVYYDEGIGTGTYFIKRLWQGMRGEGMLKILRDAYRFLIFNYAPGDEIFVFGFSRGAFTARSFIGFIRHAGILDVASASKIDEAVRLYKAAPAGQTGKELPAALQFRAANCRGVCVSEDDLKFREKEVAGFDPATPLLDIRYLGVWDTVCALGVPDFVPLSRYLNSEYWFHDAVLTSKVKAARHAVAIDERRLTFPPTLFGRDKVVELNAMAERANGKQFENWEVPYQEQWFPGVHGAIGGGGQDRGLSDCALHWVLSGARRAGLVLRTTSDSAAYAVHPDPFAPIFNDPPRLMKRLLGRLHDLIRAGRKGPAHPDEISLAAYRRWFDVAEPTPYRPRALRRAATLLDGWAYRSPPQWTAMDAQGVLEEHPLDQTETLSILARDRLGDVKRWGELFQFNRDRIDDPDYLPSGTVLRVPPLRLDKGDQAT